MYFSAMYYVYISYGVPPLGRQTIKGLAGIKSAVFYL